MIRTKTNTDELIQADRDLRDIDRRLDRLEYRMTRTWLLLGILCIEVALTVEWKVVFEWIGILI